MKNKFDQLYDEVILESSLSRIRDKMMKHSCGAVSAFRGNLSYAVNMENHKKLQAYLQSKNYSITLVQGIYIENYYSKIQQQIDQVKKSSGVYVSPPKKERNVSEKSFFVCNDNVEGDDGGALKKDLIKMGKHFDQDSVLIIPVGAKDAYLYGTNETGYPGYDMEAKVGDAKYSKTASEFISKISGRPFAFHGKEEDLYDPEGEFKVYEDDPEEKIKIHEDIQFPNTVNGKWAYSIILKKIKNELNEG